MSHSATIEPKVYIEPPVFSDGVDGEPQAARTWGSKAKIYVDLRELIHADFTCRFGNMIYTIRHGEENKKAFLSRLPNGYALGRSTKHNYIYGHPSKLRYRSLSEFTPHLEWLEKRSNNYKGKCECLHCKNQGSTTTALYKTIVVDKPDIQSSPKFIVAKTEITKPLYWDEVQRVQKIIIKKKHHFPPLVQKLKKKKEDYGSLNDLKPFAVQVPDILPNPGSDYLLRGR